MKLYAVLPLVELAHEKTISMGPVLFWPVTRFPAFLPSEEHENFRKYLETSPCINTCISIDESIPIDQQEALVLDALHLLNFNSSFRDIYYLTESNTFDLLRNLIPLPLDSQAKSENTHSNSMTEKKLVCLSCLETEVIDGLGIVLASAYADKSDTSSISRRLISAIRYFNNCLFPRFINYYTKQEIFSKNLFEPEDCILLAASFEALFDLPENNPVTDFKYKMRPLLHLNYSHSLETFWKWADNFYAIRRHIVKGKTHPTPLYRLNSNFAVSHGIIGSLLFIYSIYYFLFSHNFIKATEANPDYPPDFKWIHPENLLIFFWTESEILDKISLLLSQAEEKSEPIEIKREISFLSRLFLAFQKLYHQEPREDLQFFPTPENELIKKVSSILKSSEQPFIRNLLSDDFYNSLLQKNSGCQ